MDTLSGTNVARKINRWCIKKIIITVLYLALIICLS